VLSEIAPQNDWVELYNPTTITQTLSGWQLDDGFAITAPFTITDATIAPHGFLVVDREELRQFETGTLQLLWPDGRGADVATYASISKGTTMSRYPVHGGGWQVGTPPTPGRLNLPAPSTPTPTVSDTLGKKAAAVPLNIEHTASSGAPAITDRSKLKWITIILLLVGCGSGWPLWTKWRRRPPLE
jgi:hypothetical protein